MGFLDSLFRRKGGSATPVAERPEAIPDEDVPCPHGSLVPRWDRPEDMGKSEMVSTYLCESCGRSFSREDGKRLMAQAGEAVRVPEEERS
jgi:hypothetical protein